MNKGHMRQIGHAVPNIKRGHLYELAAAYFGFRTYAAMVGGKALPTMPGTERERVCRAAVNLGVPLDDAEIVLSKLNEIKGARHACAPKRCHGHSILKALETSK